MTMPCPWRGSWDTDKANPNVYMIIATRLRPKPGAASATIRGREPRILIEMGQMVAKHKERLLEAAKVAATNRWKQWAKHSDEQQSTSNQLQTV